MNNTNFKTLLKCIRDMIKRNRVAYKDYIGNGEYEIKKLPDELLSDNVVKAGDVEKINSDISSINSDISSINSDISSINSDISSINSDISSINSDISSINSDISSMNSRYVSKWTATINDLTVTSGFNVKGAATFNSMVYATGEILLYGDVILANIIPEKINNPASKYYVDAKISDTEIFLKSSTAGSTKTFKITVDDAGVLTATAF